MDFEKESKSSELSILNKLDESSKLLVKACEEVVAEDENYCHTELAPRFGDQPAKWIKMVDEKLETLARAAVNNIKANNEKDRTWDKIIAQFQNLPMLRSTPEEDVHNENLFSTHQEGECRSQSHDEVTAPQVNAWFRGLISDEEVPNATPIDIKQLAALLTSVGIKFSKTSPEREVTKRNIVDIGVLRFPDLDDPFIMLYRIELMLVAEIQSTDLAQTTARGVICGGYHCRKYKPTAELIGSEEAKVIALIADAETTLMNLGT